MIRNYSFDAGVVSIPVPTENRPPISPGTTSVVMDFGTFDLTIPTAPNGAPSTMPIVLGEMSIPIGNQSYPDSISLVLGTRTVRYDDGLPDQPKPNWPEFRLAVLASPALLRITSQAPAILVANLTEVAWRLDTEPERFFDFASIWNAIATIAQPTTLEISQLNAIAAATHIPFVLNDDGLL
jgi:hypothetical protein